MTDRMLKEKMSAGANGTNGAGGHGSGAGGAGNGASGHAGDSKYEALYTELLARGEQLHESNKKRIRRGIIVLIILPVVLEFIRELTDSDKVVFLIIWILIMFVLSAYLISVEYLDSAIENTLRDVTDTEADFDGLLPRPDLRRTELLRGDLHERIKARISERRAEAVIDEEGMLEEEADRLEAESKQIEAQVRESEAEVAEDEELAENEEDIASALEVIDELHEAEDAMKELRESAPPEIIEAMKEAFAASAAKQAALEAEKEARGEEDEI